MKFRNIILMAVSVILLNACSKEKITGSGATRTELRNTAAFKAVSIFGANNVYIIKGAALKVEVIGYENLLPYFESNVVNNELRLGYRSGKNIRNDNIKVYITMPDEISFLNIVGSANISVTGNFVSTQIVDLLINGSGHIYFEQGSAPKATLLISGSGNINAFGLLVKESTASINGSGDITTTVTEKLDASITGSGTIYHKGSPATVNSTIIGSGKVIKQ